MGKRIWWVIIIAVFFSGNVVFAQEVYTVLPGTDATKLSKEALPSNLKDRFVIHNGYVAIGDCRQLKDLHRAVGEGLNGKYLATKIRCGQMHMGDVPYYITHALQFAVWAAGTIAVIMIMVGGYQYAIGGITENKEQGKQTIRAAIIGLIVVLISWIVVSVIQVTLVTPTTHEGLQTTESGT